MTPETCRVALQWTNICILLHLLDFLFTLNYDARNRELKAVKTFDATATGSTDCSVHCRILGWTSPIWCYCYRGWHTENFSVYVLFLKYVLCSNWWYVAFTLCFIKFNNWILVNGFHISVLLMWCKSFRCCTRNCFYLYFVQYIFWLLFQGPHDSSECIVQDLCCINETISKNITIVCFSKIMKPVVFSCIKVLLSLWLLCKWSWAGAACL